MNSALHVKALLLAAGLGTRLRPITNTIPKCLVTIDDRPLLGYWLELLSEAGVAAGDVLINLHHHADAVWKFLSEDPLGRGVRTVYETELLGTGGTLLANADFFTSAANGVRPTVLFVHADNLSLFSLHDFIERHRARPASVEITMMTFRTDAPQTFGIVELDERDVVQKFHEKQANPPGNLANGAVYLLEASVLDFLKSLGKNFIDFSLDVIPAYLGRIQIFQNDIYHRDIGNLDSLEIARRTFPPVYNKFHRISI